MTKRAPSVKPVKLTASLRRRRSSLGRGLLRQCSIMVRGLGFHFFDRDLRAIYLPNIGDSDALQGGKEVVRPTSWMEHSHTSHVTRHTSHIAHHTSHITHHTSHITHHTSHITHHTPHITNHTSHITRHTSPAPSSFRLNAFLAFRAKNQRCLK